MLALSPQLAASRARAPAPHNRFLLPLEAERELKLPGI